MTIHIHREPLKELLRRQYGAGDRWCFRCRKRRRFELVILTPVDIMSYYGPSTHVECAACHTQDGDCFPGTQREWSDPA
jgi:hypothetical protein